jgi:hypothetical protein
MKISMGFGRGRRIDMAKSHGYTPLVLLITFERIEIKILAFRRFVARQLAVLGHSSKLKICFILEQLSTLSS